jgi:hypothetical protein
MRLLRTPCCGAESLGGAEIKLPPGAGDEIMNCGSGSFLFTIDLIEKKS